MQNHIDIRPFNRAIQSAVRDLILRGLSEHWGSIDESLNPDLSDIAEAYASGHFVVAYIDRRLVGTGGFLPLSTVAIEIRRMSVDSKFRRRGVASSILENLISHATERGYLCAKLETTAEWNQAISFYEQFGFSNLGVRKGEAHFEKNL